jgi:hypothetical protein
MQSKFIHTFINSAGVLLLAAASALFIGNWANTDLVEPRDPIFMISMDHLFWVLAGIALAIALACLLVKGSSLQLMLILWFSADMMLYCLGLVFMHIHGGFRGFLSSVAAPFWISAGFANVVLYASIFYLLIGSGLSLALLKIREKSYALVAQKKSRC